MICVSDFWISRYVHANGITSTYTVLTVHTVGHYQCSAGLEHVPGHRKERCNQDNPSYDDCQYSIEFKHLLYVAFTHVHYLTLTAIEAFEPTYDLTKPPCLCGNIARYAELYIYLTRCESDPILADV